MNLDTDNLRLDIFAGADFTRLFVAEDRQDHMSGKF